MQHHQEWEIRKPRPLMVVATLLISLLFTSTTGAAQKKPKPKPKPTAPPVTELSKLREEFVQATKEYRASLEKLLSIYENNVKKAEEKLAVSRKLFEEGLIAKAQIDEYERAVVAAKEKVSETTGQMASADTQVADIMVEAQAEEQIAKNLRQARGSLLRTTSFMRYAGAEGWGLTEAWKVQRFFTDSFNKPLPIAVFGQGAIHERWRLDHRNAMDISLHPDSAEGQALLNFLQKNGVPFSAFRGAIPGTATGPHIHIGRPSHRY